MVKDDSRPPPENMKVLQQNLQAAIHDTEVARQRALLERRRPKSDAGLRECHREKARAFFSTYPELRSK